MSKKPRTKSNHVESKLAVKVNLWLKKITRERIRSAAGFGGAATVLIFLLCWLFLPEPIKIKIPHFENVLTLQTRISARLSTPTPKEKVGIWFVKWKYDEGDRARTSFINLLQQSVQQDVSWASWLEIRTLQREVEGEVEAERHERTRNLGEKVNAAMVLWAEVLADKTDIRVTIVAPIDGAPRELGPISVGARKPGFGKIISPEIMTDKALGLVRLVRAYSALKVNRTKASADLFESAIPYFKDEIGILAGIHHMAGIARFDAWTIEKSRGDLNAARDHYEYAAAHCLEVKSNNSGLCVNARVNLGVVAKERGDWKAAIAYHEEALKFDSPDRAVVYANIGALQSELRKWKQAEAAFKSVLLLKPEWESAKLNYSRTLIMQGKGEEAEKMLRSIPAKSDINLTAEALIGNALCIQGRFDEAEAWLNGAINRKPESIHAYLSMGDCLSMHGRTAEAVNFYKKAIALEPKHPAAASATATLRQLKRREQE